MITIEEQLIKKGIGLLTTFEISRQNVWDVFV